MTAEDIQAMAIGLVFLLTVALFIAGATYAHKREEKRAATRRVLNELAIESNVPIDETLSNDELRARIISAAHDAWKYEPGPGAWPDLERRIRSAGDA